MMSGGNLGVLSIVHLDHGKENGWESISSEVLRVFEVPCSATVEVDKGEMEEGEEEEEEEEEDTRSELEEGKIACCSY